MFLDVLVISVHHESYCWIGCVCMVCFVYCMLYVMCCMLYVMCCDVNTFKGFYPYDDEICFEMHYKPCKQWNHTMDIK